MKPVITAIVVAALTLPLVQTASASEALAKSNGCLNCHANDAKKVGPSFKSIAQKYKGDAKAEATMIGKLKAGKEHPAVKASDDDLKALAKWILAM